MPRKVFFSFHYDADIRRVVQIRNSWVVRSKGETQPFLDKAEWESFKRTGSSSIERWIEEQLKGTSVTVVLFGAQTYSRPWVKHEIKRSYELGKGLVAIDIHSVRDPQLGVALAGRNPLDHWSANRNGQMTSFSQLYRTYDWVRDDGYSNAATWIEQAALAAGR